MREPDRGPRGPAGLIGFGPDGLALGPNDFRVRKWSQRRADVLALAPAISVVVCTRDRPDGLAVLLEALARQEYPNFEVIVVDNAPSGSATRDAVAGFSGRRVRYVRERRPGLSWARNAGLAAAYESVVAYIDDDEMPDAYWLAELACGFAAAPDVAAVGGLIISASLETKAEQVFEGLGGHSKGRGFAREIFDVRSHRLQHPLYPLPFFVAGGNMAFRRTVLEDIGGFDVALGAGTRAKGAEDTAAVADVMMRGGTVVWQPSAFVYHRHYPSFAGAERQVYGYGVGITAFYARVVLRSPRHTAQLARLTVGAARDMFRPGSLRNAGFDGEVPELAALRAARRRGMANGPLAYIRSTLEQRQLANEWPGW